MGWLDFTRSQIMTRSWWDAEGMCLRWEVVPESEWRAPRPPPEETLQMIRDAVRSVLYRSAAP